MARASSRPEGVQGQLGLGQGLGLLAKDAAKDATPQHTGITLDLWLSGAALAV